MTRIHPVVIAGGSGTRFWPLSRASRPKQFLPLVSDRPLIVDTVARLPPLASPKDVYVVCGKAHAIAVRRLLRQVPKAHVLVEPIARNTAPAIGLAAIHVACRDPQAVMLILPSDHHIADAGKFRETLRSMATLAAEGYLATIGITPTRPETGYGYIHLGPALETREKSSARQVRQFVEKPNVDRAREYVASGDYLWNAGIFGFRADVILREIERNLPKLHAALEAIAAAIGTASYARVLARRFPESESISIDYGIMERSGRIACVRGDFGWSDVGSFDSLGDLRPADSNGNVSQGEAILIDSRGCVVLGGKRPVAAIGLKDIIIVDSGDAVLVAPRSRAQDVRQAVEEARRRGLRRVL